MSGSSFEGEPEFKSRMA